MTPSRSGWWRAGSGSAPLTGWRTGSEKCHMLHLGFNHREWEYRMGQYVGDGGGLRRMSPTRGTPALQLVCRGCWRQEQFGGRRKNALHYNDNITKLALSSEDWYHQEDSTRCCLQHHGHCHHQQADPPGGLLPRA